MESTMNDFKCDMCPTFNVMHQGSAIVSVKACLLEAHLSNMKKDYDCCGRILELPKEMVLSKMTDSEIADANQFAGVVDAGFVEGELVEQIILAPYRIDNEKGYSKANCKWSTLAEQEANKRSKVKI